MLMQQIAEAIRESKTISLWYNGGMRVVEPHCCGHGTDGQGLLRCWHVSGHSQSGREPWWRLFRLDGMRDVSAGDHFTGTRDGYNHDNDPAIKRVVAKL